MGGPCLLEVGGRAERETKSSTWQTTAAPTGAASALWASAARRRTCPVEGFCPWRSGDRRAGRRRQSEANRDSAPGTEGLRCRSVGTSSPRLTRASLWGACGVWLRPVRDEAAAYVTATQAIQPRASVSAPSHCRTREQQRYR